VAYYNHRHKRGYTEPIFSIGLADGETDISQKNKGYVSRKKVISFSGKEDFNQLKRGHKLAERRPSVPDLEKNMFEE
jgi:hypothetical protein